MSDASEITTTAPAPAPVKPGWKTSELYLHLAAIILSACFAAGVIPASGPVAQIAAIAAVVLTSLGYSVSRTIAKRPPPAPASATGEAIAVRELVEQHRLLASELGRLRASSSDATASR
jgi:hypothetical protein